MAYSNFSSPLPLVCQLLTLWEYAAGGRHSSAPTVLGFCLASLVFLFSGAIGRTELTPPENIRVRIVSRGDVYTHVNVRALFVFISICS